MKKFVETFKNDKKDLLNIIVFSILLSTIINIVSNYVCDELNIKPYVVIILGAVIIIAMLLLYLFSKKHKLDSTVEFKGCFIVDRKSNNKMIRIPDYPINKNMINYLDSAFAENSALKEMWENGNLQMFESPISDKKGHIYAQTSSSVELLIELIEYSILEHFSTFICDYFNKLNMNDKVECLYIDSVPDVLLSNRFLRLFSENMENREAFLNDADEKSDDKRDNSNVVMAFGANGALFKRFDLTLPKNTKVKKDGKNTIVIDTNLFVIKIHYLYGGFSTIFDGEFYKYYIGDKKSFKYDTFQFNVNVDVKYKWSSIFKLYNWNLYNWFDDYLDSLHHYCDKNAFLNDINWDGTKSIIRVIKNINEATEQ